MSTVGRRRHRHAHLRRAEARLRVEPGVPGRRDRRAHRRRRPLQPRRDAGRLRTARGRRRRHGEGQLLPAGEEGGRTPQPTTTPSTRTSSVRSSTRRRASTRPSRARSTSPTSPPTRRLRSSRPARASSRTAARSSNLVPFDKNGSLAPQWADPRVWQALSIAIDREAYVNAVHPGEIPTANALPADSPGLPSRARRGVRVRPRRGQGAAGRGRLPRRLRRSTSRSTRAASATSRPCSPTGRRSAST